MNKKLKKTGSYLSMENLDINEDDERDKSDKKILEIDVET